MSLNRLIYYSAIIGGWAALLAWCLTEFFVERLHLVGYAKEAVNFAVVGAAIGGGLNLVSGMANAQWKEQLKRLVPGLLLGGLGGAVGGLIGNFVFTAGLPRGLGWFVTGSCIGAVDGISELSWKKIRNGLIGGAIGGLIAGFLFEPIGHLTGDPPRGMTSRALGFVLVGLCVGALIGLVQVILKQAWLTVLDGYKPGRQLILSREVTTLGRAENAALPFFGLTAREVEKKHATIVRQSNGQFLFFDLGTRAGTKVNGVPVQGSRLLKDGDQIRLGGNIIRFNMRARRATAVPVAGVAAPRVPAAVVAAPTVPMAAPAAPVAAISVGPVPVSVPPPPPARVMPSPAPVPPARVAEPQVTVGGSPAPEAQPAFPDACPQCGTRVPGPPGRRRCLRHGIF
jgi:hypothetical protein